MVTAGRRELMVHQETAEGSFIQGDHSQSVAGKLQGRWGAQLWRVGGRTTGTRECQFGVGHPTETLVERCSQPPVTHQGGLWRANAPTLSSCLSVTCLCSHWPNPMEDQRPGGPVTASTEVSCPWLRAGASRWRVAWRSPCKAFDPSRGRSSA